MKILIIGGTGAISTAVTKQLSETTNEVTILHRKETSTFPNVKVIQGDINDPNIKDKLDKYDVVIDFIVFNMKDMERDYKLFKDVNQYIFISTASVYYPSNYPLSETSLARNDYWKYSQDKLEVEKFVLDKVKEGFNATIVRPSHTYCDSRVPVPIHGKCGTWQVVERILHDKPVIVHGDGETLWTFTYNHDFAKGLIGLLNRKECIGEIFHITSDEVLTWNESIRLIGKAFNKEVRIVHVPTDLLTKKMPSLEGQMRGDKSVCRVFNNDKIKKFVPSFKATTSLEEGLHIIKEYIDSHPECKVIDKEFDEWCDEMADMMSKL